MARAREEQRRVHYTIDKTFDGDEGAIFWYCQMIDGKVYPLQVKYPYFDATIPSTLEVFQIDYFFPYMFVLFKNLSATPTNAQYGRLLIVRIDNPSVFKWIDNVVKYDFIEIQGALHFIILYQERGENKLRSNLLTDEIINRDPYLWTGNWLLESDTDPSKYNVPPVIIDFSIYNNRILLFTFDNGKSVIWYSKFYLSSIPQWFLDDTANNRYGFTFPEYFFLSPPLQQFVLYKNFLITNIGVYKIEEQQVGGVFQLVPIKILDLTLDFTKTNIQFNILGGVLSTQTHTYELYPNINIYTNFFVPTFLSNTAYPVFKTQIISSCILPNKRRIDYSSSVKEKMILAGEGLFREVKEGDNKRVQIFYLDKQSPYILDGKLIFISAFQDYLNLKYLKRIKIRRFKDLYDMEGYAIITDIKVPEFPLVPQGIITEEEQEIEPENPANLRQVGKYFFIEVKPIGGVLPILELEYDRGK
jgi:hypothetical protein